MAKKIIGSPRVTGPQVAARRVTGRLLVRIDPRAELKDILKGMKGVVLERLRIAVVEEESAAELRRRADGKGSAFLAVEPERVIRKIDGAGGASGGSGSSGRGSGSSRSGSGDSGGGFADSRAATWGIQATNVLTSAFTGKGVKLAVLDTGFDFTHPDFAGRTIHRKAFVGRQAIDKDGHGTHCAGIAGGNRAIAKVRSEKDRGEAGPTKLEALAKVAADRGKAGSTKATKGKEGVRYGVAPGSRLYIGKILDDNGEGADGLALAGIEWALEKGCHVISMSFGAEPEEGYSAIFESVAQTVLAHRCLLVAATGNDSKRGRMAPVNHPANCPSVLAVGALTAGMKLAEFSCGGVGVGAGRAGVGGVGGGQVDLVAPGEEILSAKVGGGHSLDSGTSMAAPFVAGIAALLWEQYPAASGYEIYAKLMQRARRLGLPATAVGAGLAVG